MQKKTLQTLPKVDLHLHLDGAANPETLWELAHSNSSAPPEESFDNFKKKIQVDEDCTSLNDFLDTFSHIIPILGRKEAVERIAYELCRSLEEDHVIYCETRFSPHLIATEEFPPENVVQAALRGFSRGTSEFSVEVGVILCCLHGLPRETYSETVDLALEYRSRGVVGVDIAGREDYFQIDHFEEHFQRAKNNGLGVTVHAGESGPVQNMKQAIHELDADRIGHGLQLVDDSDLVDTVLNQDILLEYCLTSNVQTQAVPSLEEHPFPKTYEIGVPVSLNTDDPGVSGISLTDDYEKARSCFDLDHPDFYHLNKTALRHAFVSDERKRTLQDKLCQETKKLDVNIGEGHFCD